MKGILLAAGRGTRLYPMTRSLSKQLLPIYDKPMIYYPLSALMLGGIREILVITTPEDAPLFRLLLGDGRQWGISLSYAEQASPGGVAEALLIGRDFLAGDGAALMLGDNLIYGDGLTEMMQRAVKRAVGNGGATVFGYRVGDPERYGVVEFDHDGTPVSIVEKPTAPRSHWAVIGLYVYDRSVSDLAARVTPSARGELEISDLNALYLKRGSLTVERLGRGYAWFDTGTAESLIEAAEFVRTLEKRTGQMIGSIEEVAFRQGFIGKAELARFAAQCSGSEYGRNLARVVEENS